MLVCYQVLLVLSSFFAIGNDDNINPSGEKAPAFVVDTLVQFKAIPQKHIELLVDSTGELRFEDIREARFINIPQGFRREAGITYWIRFKVHNTTDVAQEMLAYFGRTEFMALYECDLFTKQYVVRTSGRRVAYKDIQGFINYGNFVRLTIPASQEATYYVQSRFERNFYVTPQVIAWLYAKDKASSDQYYANIIAATFIGTLLVMLLYTMLLSLSLRDKVYYHYVGFIFFGLFFYLYFYGFTMEWIWPNWPVWDIFSFVYILSGTYFFWLQFSRGFLHTSANLPAWDKYLRILAWIHLLPSVLVIPDMLGWMGPHFLKKLSDAQNLLGIITLMSIFSVSVQAYRKDVRSAKFFLGANSSLLLGTLVLILRFLGVLPDLFVVMYAGQFGFFMQMILFSLGLGDRINRMREELVLKDLENLQLEQVKEFEKNKLIREKNIELEAKVRERTLAIENQKKELERAAITLADKNEELLQVNEFKDKLFSIIGHDLRNPLGALQGILEIQKSGELSKEEMVEISKDLDTSLKNVMGTLDNLLVWALQQMNTIKHHPMTLSVKEEVEKVVELMHVKAMEKQIVVKQSIDDSLQVLCDKEMMQLILRNMLSNALKFTPEHGKVEISAQDVGKEICISIKDSGVGIAPELQHRLFGNDLYSTRGTNNERGTGLGLKLCKDFVEKNKGSIHLESELGSGTTFHIRLPKPGGRKKRG